MEKIEIHGQYRNNSGKGVARQLRRDGKVPAVIYSKGSSKPLTLNPKEVDAVRHSSAGENAMVNLKVFDENQKEIASHVAILRDFQKDPLTGKVLHADLFEISMSDEIDVNVVIEIIGSVPLGVKNDGGSLRQQLRELEVRCLPSDIPDHIQVDASNLEIGDTIHVKDLSLPTGVKVLDSEDLAVVSVSAAISEEKLEELLTATPEEGKVPEVTAQKPEGEGEEEEKKDAKETKEQK